MEGQRKWLGSHDGHEGLCRTRVFDQSDPLKPNFLFGLIMLKLSLMSDEDTNCKSGSVGFIG